jgi:transposase
MLTVEDYRKIRVAHSDGMSIREIARKFHRSRRKIRQVLQEPEPRPYTRRKEPSAPQLGPFRPLIRQILAEDEQAPRKQRHTAAKIFRRLRNEYGYQGGYDQVRRYVAKQRKRLRETFIPLDHPPGRRLEADFGHIYVDFPDGRRRVPVMVTTWSYSGRPFARGLPTERTEAILAGMVEAFTFFDCVPREVWWDNPKTVAKKILKGRQRELHGRYEALASHYRFEPLFCMPARGNEKPYAENSVYNLQRDWATPVPKVENMEQLNEYLRQCCLRKCEHQISGKNQTIGERFQQDKAAALALPKRSFDPCIAEAARVDKYQTVRFDTNRYTVPRRWAFETVTIKAYINRIDIVAAYTVIASHQRSYERGQLIFQEEHYLAILGRRPAALDHSAIFRQWQLPACFTRLREDFEARHGCSAGARQYIRVLQLLAEHPAQRVQKAIEQCRTKTSLHADLIIQTTQRLAHRYSADDIAPAELYVDNSVPIQVPRPDLNRFDRLLTQTQGESNDVRKRTTVIESESQTTTFAGNPGRTREIGPGSSPTECRLSTVFVTSGGTGSGSAGCQCPQNPDQAGGLPGSEGF